MWWGLAATCGWLSVSHRLGLLFSPSPQHWPLLFNGNILKYIIKHQFSEKIKAKMKSDPAQSRKCVFKQINQVRWWNYHLRKAVNRGMISKILLTVIKHVIQQAALLFQIARYILIGQKLVIICIIPSGGGDNWNKKKCEIWINVEYRVDP